MTSKGGVVYLLRTCYFYKFLKKEQTVNPVFILVYIRHNTWCIWLIDEVEMIEFWCKGLYLILVNVICFSDNIFYSNINTETNISWTTSLGQIYGVQSPSNKTIYTVRGDILPNADMNKYMVNSKGTEQIDISVLNVSQNDGGIYQSVDASGRPNGCCLLIITGLYIMVYFKK